MAKRKEWKIEDFIRRSMECQRQVNADTGGQLAISMSWAPPSHSDEAIAKKIARMIFESPMTDGSGDAANTVRRLAFRGGTDKKETDLGGMNEDCLVREILRGLRLIRQQPSGGEKQT